MLIRFLAVYRIIQANVVDQCQHLSPHPWRMKKMQSVVAAAAITIMDTIKAIARRE